MDLGGETGHYEMTVTGRPLKDYQEVTDRPLKDYREVTGRSLGGTIKNCLQTEVIERQLGW